MCLMSASYEHSYRIHQHIYVYQTQLVLYSPTNQYEQLHMTIVSSAEALCNEDFEGAKG